MTKRLKWELGARGGRYLYKRELHTDHASGDLIVGVASWFYGIVCDAFLEHLIIGVQKSKKPMNDQNARASDGHQEEERRRAHGETLTGCFN
jgi:hypothetical protein